jgi:regulator of cell morphogenesis and NO signaling
METTQPKELELDVRALTPPLRHRVIFQALDALAPGQTLRLINDHNPSPLSFQLRATRPGRFAWVAGERGPEVWSAAITRVGASSDTTTPVPSIEASHTVHQIVSRYPQMRATFAYYGIDLCCGSGLSLTQAVAAAGVALEDLLTALNDQIGVASAVELPDGDA